jgi:hypothetical protein
MAHVDRRDQTQIDTLAADLFLKPAGLVATMDSSESGAGGQTPGPRSEKRPSEVASEVARDTYFSLGSEDWLSKGFGPDSIAHHQVVCADTGGTPHDSLGAPIPSSLTHQIVNKHQAKLLWKLNANANEAKHGWWFHGETTTGTAASSS